MFLPASVFLSVSLKSGSLTAGWTLTAFCTAESEFWDHPSKLHPQVHQRENEKVYVATENEIWQVNSRNTNTSLFSIPPQKHSCVCVWSSMMFRWLYTDWVGNHVHCWARKFKSMANTIQQSLKRSASFLVFMFIFFCFGSAGDRTQGFGTLGKCSTLSYASSPSLLFNKRNRKTKIGDTLNVTARKYTL